MEYCNCGTTKQAFKTAKVLVDRDLENNCYIFTALTFRFAADYALHQLVRGLIGISVGKSYAELNKVEFMAGVLNSVGSLREEMISINNIVNDEMYEMVLSMIEEKIGKGAREEVKRNSFPGYWGIGKIDTGD